MSKLNIWETLGCFFIPDSDLHALVRGFEKGLADRGGWREELADRGGWREKILPMPEIQASFLHLFPTPLIRRRTQFCKPFLGPCSIDPIIQAKDILGVSQRPLTLIRLQMYRDTNGRRIVIQIGVYTTFCQEEGILLQKYRDRYGRCIAILFTSIRVRGRLDSPQYPKDVNSKNSNYYPSYVRKLLSSQKQTPEVWNSCFFLGLLISRSSSQETPEPPGRDILIFCLLCLLWS